MNRPKWLPKWLVAVAAGVMVTAGVAGCSRSSTPAAGRIDVDGQAEISRAGENRREITGSRDLKTGDRVRILQGAAVVRLPGGHRFELRIGTDVEMRSTPGGSEARPALIGGDLLAVSGDRPLAVEVTGADVTVQGDARVSRGVALLVASYKGTAQLRAAGSTFTIAALRQAALPATGQFPTKASPLEYSGTDAWDQRYLSDAIELSNQLAARSEGFTAQLGATDGRSVAYYRDLFPRLAAEPAFTAALVNPSRPPGETLVGTAITLEGTRGTFAERWGAVFGFRDEGAPWGLVALDQGVGRTPLLAAIQGASSRGPNQFAAGPPTRAPSSLAPPNGGGPATTAVPTTRVTTTTIRPRAGVTTTAPPTTTTTIAGPLNTGAPLVDNTVNSLVKTLTGLLNSLGGQ